MKNTKILISEISRINELMGVQLLSEQAFAKVADDVIDFFRKSGKSIDDATFDLLDNLRKATSDYEIGRILTDISKKSPEIGKKIVQTYTDVLKKDPYSPFNTMKNNLLDGINNKGLTKDEVSKLIDNYTDEFKFDELKNTLRTELNDFADDLLSKKSGKTPPPVSSTKGGISPSVLNVAAEKFSKGILDGAGLTRSEKILLNRQWPIAMNLGKIFLNYNSAKAVKYVDDVFSNLKQMLDESASSNSIQKLQDKLTLQINDLNTRGTADPKLFKENILNSLSEANVDYKTIQKIRGYLNDADIEDLTKSLEKEGVIKNSTLGLVVKDFSEKNIKQIGKRIAGLITYGHLRLPEEIIKLGGKGSFATRTARAYGWLVIATKVMIPTVIGLLWSIVTAVGAQMGMSEKKPFMDRLLSEIRDFIGEGFDEIYDLFPFSMYIDNIGRGLNLMSLGQLFNSDKNKEELKQKIEELPTIPNLPKTEDTTQDQGDTTATEEQPVTEPSGTYGTTLDEFKRFLKSNDPEAWGPEDYKTLTNVDNKVINNINYYRAFDGTTNEYYFTYDDGTYKQYKNE
jgi:hypothetical protein